MASACVLGPGSGGRGPDRPAGAKPLPLTQPFARGIVTRMGRAGNGPGAREGIEPAPVARSAAGLARNCSCPDNVRMLR